MVGRDCGLATNWVSVTVREILEIGREKADKDWRKRYRKRESILKEIIRKCGKMNILLNRFLEEIIWYECFFRSGSVKQKKKKFLF